MSKMYCPIPRGAIRLPLPDTMQKTDYSCGASAIMAICRYFGLGCDDEEDFIHLLKKKGMDPRIGSHPRQLKKILSTFNLKPKEFNGMTVSQLKKCLLNGQPVLMMIQAWGEDKKGRPLKSYSDVWSEGHWVVGIGFDKSAVFFEDPSLEAIRGYISYDELEERWHDTGPHNKRMEHYGMAVRKPSSLPAWGYTTRARHID